MFDHATIAHQLARNAETIRHLMDGIDEQQARWKPTDADWSIVEVINHLYDEEREDFRMRVDYTLHKPDAAWPPIDPVGWVTERRYNERDFVESLQNFLREREQSVAWLVELVAPTWDSAKVHPAGFTLRAGDLLAAWLAHDFLHLRQLVELHYACHAQQALPYQVEYAGDW